MEAPVPNSEHPEQHVESEPTHISSNGKSFLI